MLARSEQLRDRRKAALTYLRGPTSTFRFTADPANVSNPVGGLRVLLGTTGTSPTEVRCERSKQRLAGAGANQISCAR